MPERTQVINQSLLRCHLVALIDLAGAKTPPGYKVHPDAAKLDAGMLLRAVEAYRAFLRSPRSLS